MAVTRIGTKFRHTQIDPWIRRAVIDRDLGRCRFCGTQTGGRWRPTIDHLIPKVIGGGNNIDNLVVACFRCNQQKRGRTPDEAGMKLLPIGSVVR